MTGGAEAQHGDLEGHGLAKASPPAGHGRTIPELLEVMSSTPMRLEGAGTPEDPWRPTYETLDVTTTGIPPRQDDDPADELIAELVAAMNTPVSLEGRDLTPEASGRLEALSLNVWRCERCAGWVARLGNAGPSRHVAEDLADLNPELVADLANELAGVGWADPLDDECDPHAAAAAHNRRELAAAVAYDERLRLELVKAGGTPPPAWADLDDGAAPDAFAHNARLLGLMGDPPPVVVGSGTPEDPYRDLSTPLIASHCLGPEPWWARHERPLRAALWGVVVLVGASTLLAVFTAERHVWLQGLLGTTVGAFALLVTRRGRRGWGPR